MAKLTRSVIANAQPGDRDQFIFCDDPRGFGLKVTPAGRKIFVLQYRFNRKPTWITLGDFTILSLDDARTEAKRKLAALLDGKDPMAIRDAQRSQEAELSVGQLVDKWRTEAVPKKTRAPLTI